MPLSTKFRWHDGKLVTGNSLQMTAKRFSNEVNIRNRKAFFNYEILEKYIAGMVLKGTEIKSVREGKVNLTDGYCYFNGDELFVKGISISTYKQGTIYNHEPERERKLLLKRAELKKLKSKTDERGLSLIPIRVFTTARGFAKLEIALAKGKKTHDKRESIRERDSRRELARIKTIR